MPGIRFKIGLTFWLNGKVHEIVRRLKNGDFQVIDVATLAISEYSEEALCKLFFDSKLTFKDSSESCKQRKKDYIKADFSQIEISLKSSAQRKLKYVKGYLESGLQKRNEESLKPIIAEVAEKLKDDSPPHWITVYRWIKKYESSGGDVRCLVEKDISKGGNQQLNSEVSMIIQEVIKSYYLQLEKPNVADVFSRVVFEITRENVTRYKIGLSPLKIPHRSTIYRIVDKIDPYEEMVARYGRASADKMFNSVKYEPPQTMRPMEVVEIDHTKLPLYVIDPDTNLPIGIPTLTTTVDRYTGIPIGYYISYEPASYLSVMQCLWHSIQPKSYVKSKFPTVRHEWNCYGLMESLKVDNAPEFKGKQLEDACYQLDINLDFAPPNTAWYKAKVERFFRTISTTMLQGQPGAFLKFMKKYDDDYDPKNSAVISLESLHEIIHLFIIDIVSQMPHPDFGASRENVWLKGILKYPPLLPLSIQELRVLLGSLTHRVISKNGIEFEGLYYRSPELTRLRYIYEQRDKRRATGTKEREKAKIKFDSTDLSLIYVFDPDNHNFVAIPAVSQNYTKGLSLWQHRVIKKVASQEAKQVDIVALAIAKQKIQDIVERDWQTLNRGRTKVSMARWLGIGRDGLNTSDVEAFHEEQIAVSCNKIPNNDNSSYTTGDSDPMTGISDYGNSFNNNDVQIPLSTTLNFNSSPEIQPIDNKLEIVNADTEILENQVDSSKSAAENQKNKKTSKRVNKSRKSKGKSPATVTKNISEKIDIEKDEWKPDLSGWSVSYV
ncbi:hypothetical protein NIES2101_31975 [Calothrix sp. HK-06]|nr:hypothetical protein NIES2101_31975 [Calothrix sp. HK-06]